MYGINVQRPYIAVSMEMRQARIYISNGPWCGLLHIQLPIMEMLSYCSHNYKLPDTMYLSFFFVSTLALTYKKSLKRREELRKEDQDIFNKFPQMSHSRSSKIAPYMNR